ncbi:MAG TPA: hypothetical protein VKR54_02735 [Candidatus Babeliales bacterium]|jgi:hypothetical protein|nr:hypothetical protein [Candidatus Babeliales bacterium]
MKIMKQILALIVILGVFPAFNLLNAEQKVEIDQIEAEKLEAIKKEAADWDAAMALQRDLLDATIEAETKRLVAERIKAETKNKEKKEKEKFDLKINIYKDPLTALYKIPYGRPHLYIPEEDLIDVNSLKKIFENNNIDTTAGWYSHQPWSTEQWNKAYKEFKNLQYEKTNTRLTFYTLDELLKILAEAKTVLKSFLPPNDYSFIFVKNKYIKKYGMNRLFTYAKLQQVITEKNLTHIRLPLKFLLIEDIETGEYVSTEEALRLIDSLLKIYLDHNEGSTRIIIENMSDRYEFHIFAKRETIKGKGFSKATMEQLFTLCEEAPFDIGYDNIFWDAKGDATIIDTEHKGEPARDCYKLKRYRVDESL